MGASNLSSHRELVRERFDALFDPWGFSAGQEVGLQSCIVAVGGVAARAVISAIVGSEADGHESLRS
jgi:hypothetical protein